MYRSDDAGKHGKKVNEKAIGMFFAYGYYSRFIPPPHTNPDKVFILGLNAMMSTDGVRISKR